MVQVSKGSYSVDQDVHLSGFSGSGWARCRDTRVSVSAGVIGECRNYKDMG